MNKTATDRIAVGYLADVLDQADTGEGEGGEAFAVIARNVLALALEVKLTHGNTRLVLTFDLDGPGRPMSDAASVALPNDPQEEK